jgi:hypothetical protein
MSERKKPYKILVGKTKEKRKFSRPRSALEGNTDMGFKKQDKEVCTGISWLKMGLLNRLLSTKKRIFGWILIVLGTL